MSQSPAAIPTHGSPLEYQSPAVQREQAWARWGRSMTWLVLAWILGVALLVRFTHIDRLSLHYDETWDLTLSTGRGSMQGDLQAGRVYTGLPKLTSLQGAPPWWRIPGSLRRVTHPPLYVLMLRFWRDVFGDGDLAARAYSAIVSALSVVLLFGAVRTLHDSRAAGLWAALIMALAGPQIELAQEIRPYAQLIFLSCGALWAMTLIEVRGPSRLRLLALGGCVMGMMLTHYFAIGPCLALGAYALIRLRGRARWKVALAFAVAGIVYLALWGPFVWMQRGEFTTAVEAWLGEDPKGHVLLTLLRLAALPLRLLFEPQESTYPAAYGAAVLLILPPVLVLARKRRDLLLWTLWLAGTAGFIALLDIVQVTRHLTFVRYIAFAGPAVYAIIPVLLPRSRVVLRQVVGAGTAIGCALALGAVYSTAQPDARPLGKFLDAHVAPGEIIVFNRSGDAFWYGRVLFLLATHYSQHPGRPIMILEDRPTAEQSRVLAAAPGVWLVSGTDELTPQELFPGGRSEQQSLFPYVCVVDHVVHGKGSEGQSGRRTGR